MDTHLKGLALQHMPQNLQSLDPKQASRSEKSCAEFLSFRGRAKGVLSWSAVSPVLQIVAGPRT